MTRSPRLSSSAPRVEALRGLAHGCVCWYERHGRSFPWREEGLDPWRILLAEMLLRQTAADRALPVYLKLIAVAPTPSSLASLGEDQLSSLLHPIGLHIRRARALSALGAKVAHEWGENLPTDYRTLLSLPHVGAYAAGAVTVFALGGRAPLPDVNIARVGSRYFGTVMPRGEKATLSLARRVLRTCPKGWERPFMYGMLDLSAALCRPQNPQCSSCPLKVRCKFALAGKSSQPRREAEPRT
jgi:A/G-specific adenine glycosylase